MDLSLQQKQVLEHVKGHQLVLAGPGSGKTHTLVEKILHIFDQQVIPEPCGLLAVTFSNAAVTEINRRLWDRSFRHWERVSVRTFHSFAMQLLRCYGNDVGIREDFEIIEREGRLQLLDKLLLKHSSNMRLTDFDNYIQRFKRQGIYPECNERFVQSGEIRFQEAYRDFQDTLFEQNQLDFDDLIHFAIKLIHESTLAKKLFTRYYRYVIVDEFQDTDHQQLKLLELFTASADGSTIFADDDQAIYGFRGGNKENIQTIKRILQSQVITLTENFRSPRIIVEATHSLIAKENNRIEKNLSAMSHEIGALYVNEFLCDKNEAKAVASLICEFQEQSIVDDLGNIAVVSRNRRRAKELIHALDSAGVPWFDSSRLSFETTWESELALSILGVYCNIVSTECLYTLMAAIENSGVNHYLPDTDALDVACAIRDKLQQSFAQDVRSENVAAILEASDLYKLINLASSNASDLARRQANLNELVACVENEGRNRGKDLGEIIRMISGRDAVQLVTSHGTKGREFEYVFFIGVEDDVIPGWGQLSDERIAEERRVFYVTLTRTRKELHITHAKKVGWYRNKQRSRFIEDIPNQYFSDVRSRWGHQA